MVSRIIFSSKQHQKTQQFMAHYDDFNKSGFQIKGFKISETLYTTDSTRVYRGVRESDQSLVILRTCGEQAGPSQIARLSSSAEILRSFEHPNIVKVIDLIDATGLPCLIMEDTGSIDLNRYLIELKDHPLPLDIFLDIAIQLSDALSIIHHAQVIHKDLHLGNIVINPETMNVQIIDFGLASLLSREQPSLTPANNLEGVLAYISPEQTGRMNRSLDYRSDFYTLGVSLYHLLTGHLPFVADDAMGLVHAHIAREQIPVHECRPEVPKAISDIIDKLMNKTAEFRYQSALGLKQDLEICRRHVIAGNPIPAFSLGLNDISDRFQVPQVLYGRKLEVQSLMDSFYRAAQGKPQLLAVEGFAGIGKSALIHEIHKPIAAHSGIFTSGKFDQFQKNIPYSALKQAFSGWMQHALSLKEEALLALRIQLNESLGANARVLIDFMDVFEVLLGDLAPVAKLGAQETQNRFHLTLQRFIQEITQQRPLVIFIDDLQWADRGTLSLLPQLMSANTLFYDKHKDHNNAHDSVDDKLGCRLLLLVAYRDNEMNSRHPAAQTLQQIQSDYPSASTLTLRPLALAHIKQLLVDALHQTPEAIENLAELIEQKTGGNPFFINEFLKTLYSENLLNFDLKQQRWIWSLKEIMAQSITNNVVELMLGKMQKLPENTQRLIQLSSCIGSLFDLQTLSIISEQSMANTVRILWPALKEGLLLQEGGDWLLGLVESGGERGISREKNSSQSAFTSSEAHLLKLQLPKLKSNTNITTNMSTVVTKIVPHCRFLHDRMLQAAYQSLTEQDRQQTHLNIGRRLLEHTETNQLESQLFSIIEQLNQGQYLIESQEEKLRLAQLNLQAAEKAKLASVWEAAVEYAQVGLSLLSSEDHWQTQYTLSFGLYHTLAECMYLTGEADQSEALYNTLLANTHKDIDKAKICATRLVQTIGRGDWQLGIEYGITGLHHLGISIQTEPEEINALSQEQFNQFEQALKTTPLSHIVQLPEMTDPQLLVACSIIPNLSQCGQILGKNDFQYFCTLLGLNITLSSGKSDFTPLLLACYAVILTRRGSYSQAFMLAEQAIKISESYPNCRALSNTNNVLAGLILYLKSPYQIAINLHQKSYELGMEKGEIVRAGLNFCNILFLKVSQGVSLKTVQEHAEHALELVDHKTIFFPVPITTQKLIRALINDPLEGVDALNDEQFDSALLPKIKSSFHITHLNSYRSQLAFWYDDDERAITVAAQVQAQITLLPKFSNYIDHLIQYGLLLLSNINNQTNNQNKPLNPTLKQQAQDDLAYCQNKLQTLAELYPPNFEHKYLLFQAEQRKYQGATMDEVSALYEAAIDSAEQYGFLQYQALANELYANFWLKIKRPKIAELYLSDAINLYQRWGCQVKVNNLNARYQALFSNQQAKNATSATLHSVTQSGTQTLSQSSHPNNLDFSTVIKSTQAISGELSLKSLIAKVMQAILENSGAQNAALILESPQGPIVEARLKAQNTRESEYDINVRSIPLDSATDLPISLIAYVLRTKTEQVLQSGSNNTSKSAHPNHDTSTNSYASEAFIADPYLQAQQPKSVLCIPVTYRDKLLGALYLDNKLTDRAFPQARFDIIKMLLAQAAISFENARLFKEVSELNIGLEDKVQQRTAQLDQSNQQLDKSNQELNNAVKDLETANKALETFSYSVSHDLRSPLRMIKSFSTIIADDYHDELSPDAQVLFKKVIRGGEQMEELITGLLDLARLEQKALVRDTVNLSDIATTIITNMREQAPQQQATVQIDTNIQVSGDKRMLYSMIENLLNNAWKYSSKSQKIDITFASKQVDNKTVYYVQDQGAGFDMTHSEKLFATFQRLHTAKQFAGTGIGLATVKRIIEKHDGEIWAESEVGQGATFYFTLPE